jgi:hypothetical protein
LIIEAFSIEASQGPPSGLDGDRGVLHAMIDFGGDARAPLEMQAYSKRVG